MVVEWDPEKARRNYNKHGIAFADAVSALEDDFALTIEDDHPDERRFITLGMDALGRILVIVYTYRGENIRMISARQATAGEQAEYEARK
ncbi:MAG: BrnT family toxin [Anaerolineaceae bacterium]